MMEGTKILTDTEYDLMPMAELEERKKELQKQKHYYRRQMDNIDTEIIGITEALRQKNEEKQKLDREN